MEVIIGLLLYAISIVIYALFGAYFIRGAVIHFKRGEYYWFGGDLLMTIPWIISIMEASLSM